MNELTREIVTQVASENKAAARKNDIKFDFLVRDAHWEEMIGRVGWLLKARALEIWRWCHPEDFCEIGVGEYILDDGSPWGFDTDMELSKRTVRVLRRKIKREPELQLEDWGDLPERIADPQMRMF